MITRTDGRVEQSARIRRQRRRSVATGHRRVRNCRLRRVVVGRSPPPLDNASRTSPLHGQGGAGAVQRASRARALRCLTDHPGRRYEVDCDVLCSAAATPAGIDGRITGHSGRSALLPELTARGWGPRTPKSCRAGKDRGGPPALGAIARH